MKRISESRDLTAEQTAWLDRIQLHLVQNLSIDREDFALVPVLASQGGWTPANRTFDGQLAELLASMNEELAAV